MPHHPVAKTADIALGTMKSAVAAGKKVLVANVGLGEPE